MLADGTKVGSAGAAVAQVIVLVPAGSGTLSAPERRYLSDWANRSR